MPSGDNPIDYFKVLYINLYYFKYRNVLRGLKSVHAKTNEEEKYNVWLEVLPTKLTYHVFY